MTGHKPITYPIALLQKKKSSRQDASFEPSSSLCKALRTGHPEQIRIHPPARQGRKVAHSGGHEKCKPRGFFRGFPDERCRLRVQGTLVSYAAVLGWRVVGSGLENDGVLGLWLIVV